jgi:hypothetical protein
MTAPAIHGHKLMHLPGQFVVTVIAPSGKRYDFVGKEKMGSQELATISKAIEIVMKHEGLWEAPE